MLFQVGHLPPFPHLTLHLPEPPVFRQGRRCGFWLLFHHLVLLMKDICAARETWRNLPFKVKVLSYVFNHWSCFFKQQYQSVNLSFKTPPGGFCGTPTTSCFFLKKKHPSSETHIPMTHIPSVSPPRVCWVHPAFPHPSVLVSPRTAKSWDEHNAFEEGATGRK